MADEPKVMTPERLKVVNAAMTIFWLINLPIVVALYFILDEQGFQAFCLFYLAIVSIWALVAAHFTAYIEGRVEVKQKESGDSA